MKTTERGARPKSFWWQSSAIALSLAAALFSALTLVNDTNVLRNVIVDVSGTCSTLTPVLVYLMLGSWVGVFANLVYNRIFGRTIDPSYKGESAVNLKMQVLAFGAGALASLYTFSYLTVASEGDPSILIALSNFSVIYLAFYDHARSKVNLQRKLKPAVLVVVGVALVSLLKIGTGLEFTLKALLVILLVSSTSEAASRVFEKYGAACCDGVNFAFWRFVWLAVCSTTLALLLSVATGTLKELGNLMQLVWLKSIPWVALTMLLAYGSNTLRIVAQKHGNLSTVAVVRSSQAAMAVPVTLAVAYLAPTWDLVIPTQSAVWVLRAIGTVLIVIGVVYCAKNNT